MIGLKDGFEIEKIDFHNDFQNGWLVINLSPTLTRNIVHPVGVFDIIISREGSWLFIKLFLGSFLAFIISWIVFLIPNEEFDFCRIFIAAKIKGIRLIDNMRLEKEIKICNGKCLLKDF